MVSRKLAHVRVILRKAKEVKDPLATFASAVRTCSNNAQLVQVRSYHAKDMPKELHDWCLATCRENLAALYDRVWSWSDTKKRKQLTSVASRFLVAHDAGPGRSPLAYVNYRFEEEEAQAVLYCYELQVVRTAQSRGLGRMLMELAEQIAWGAGMSKVMLTVFVENATAVAFYRKLGYDLDETSPDYCGCSASGGSASGGSASGGSGSMGTGSSSAGSGGRSSNSSGSASSSNCSFRDGSGGSQTDSGAGAADCGYHIMSKRAPKPQPERHPPPAAVAESRHELAAGGRERQHHGDQRQSDSPPPLAVGPSKKEGSHAKRQRTEAGGGQRAGSEVWEALRPDVGDGDTTAGPHAQLEPPGWTRTDIFMSAAQRPSSSVLAEEARGRQGEEEEEQQGVGQQQPSSQHPVEQQQPQPPPVS